MGYGSDYLDIATRRKMLTNLPKNPSMPKRWVLDGTKLAWHHERFQDWLAGERIAPVTVDWALTTACQYHCEFCAKLGQTKQIASLSKRVILDTLDDMVEMGVKGVVFMSDGESTLSPHFTEAVLHAKEVGLSVACATNGYLFEERMAARVLPVLDYLRINFAAGDPDRYAQIMGVTPQHWGKVVTNIISAVTFKRTHKLPVTINLQMVLQPKDADQIMPFAQLGKDLGVDYAIIKHCLDYETGEVAIDYGAYAKLEPIIREAEGLSTPDYLVTAKWSKLMGGRGRPYRQCYGPAFLLQISGTGLVAACGPKFNQRFAEKFHIGNISETRLIDMWRGERYWEVMDYLGHVFDSKDCSPGCVQHNLNCAIDAHLKGEALIWPRTENIEHVNFI